MANFDLKFLDFFGKEDDHIKVKVNSDTNREDLIQIKGYDSDCGKNFHIFLDKSTAIKFSKTLRTEINKIDTD